MESLMVIDTAKSGIVFPLAYLAAFLFVAGIMIFEGFRKGYPKSAWLLILLTGVLFFIIGDKLFAYSPEQWGQVFTRFQFPYSDKKTLFGGITGLFTGMYLAKTWLRFNRPVLDTMALALPVAIAISCIGCLMAGCCFGTPTNLPWGVQYGETSWAFHVHQTCGLVHPASATSLTIHPVQLYQAIGCLAVAVIVLMSRKYWKSSGSLFLVSVLGYLAIRFFIEFVRAPETNSFAGQFFFGLKVNQWLIAATFIAGLFILLTRERKWIPAPVTSQLTGPTEFRLFTLTAIICLVVLLARNWFTSLEYSTLILFFIPGLFILAINFYHRHSVEGFRWVIPLLVVCCFSFMAQKSSQTGDEDDKITFSEFGFSGMVGRYYDRLKTVTDEECDGYQTAPLGTDKRIFYQGGVDYSYNIWHGKYRKLAFGGGVFVGSESGEIEMDYPHSKISYGISPFFKIDWRWFGMGTGFSLGQMKVQNGLAIEFESSRGHINNPHHSVGDVISSGYFNRNLVLALSARVGPYDIFYMEAKYPGLFPSSAPFPSVQVGFGSGLGKTNGTKVAVGFCDGDGYYAELNYPFKNNIVLKAFYTDNFYSGDKAKRLLSLGISYRLKSEKTAEN